MQFHYSSLEIEQWKLSFLTLQGNPGVVTCMDNQPHGLQTGQSVVFREVNGMEELNGTARQVSGIISTLKILCSVYFMFLKSYKSDESQIYTTKTLFRTYWVYYFFVVFLNYSSRFGDTFTVQGDIMVY